MPTYAPQDPARRRQVPDGADRRAAPEINIRTARAFLEDFYDDAATGDADLVTLASYSATLRLAAHCASFSARRALECGRDPDSDAIQSHIQHALDLAEMAAEFDYAAQFA